MENATQSTSQIQDGVTQIMTSLILMQTYSAGLLNQPILNLTSAPSLSMHQGAATEALDTWLKTGSPQAVSGVDAVKGFGDSVSTIMTDLESIVSQIENGDTALKSELINGLSELQSDAGKQLLAAKQLADAFSDNQSIFAGVATNFASDLSAVQAAGGAEVQPLNDQLAALNQELDQDFAVIAAGATNALPGIFRITVGTALLVASDGEETEVLKSGIEVTSEEMGEVSKASDDAKDKIAQYGSLLSQISQIEAELAAVATIKSGGDGCSAQATALQAGANTLAAGWQTVQQSFLDLGAMVSAGDELPPDFQSTLSAFNDAWSTVSDLVEHLESFTDLPVQQTAGVPQTASA